MDQNETLKIETSDNLLKKRFIVAMGFLLLVILVLLVCLGSMTNCACIDQESIDELKQSAKIENQSTLFLPELNRAV